MDLIKEFIKPELLILIPVMYIIGEGIKRTQIKNKLIPALLGLASIVLSSLYVVATTKLVGVQNIAMALFVSLTQGVLVAGASVYANQLVKQNQKKE